METNLKRRRAQNGGGVDNSGGSRAADVSAALDARMARRGSRRREARRSRRTDNAISLARKAILAIQMGGER